MKQQGYSELMTLATTSFNRQADVVECELTQQSRQKIEDCLPSELCQFLINTYEQNNALLNSKTLSKEIISLILNNPEVDKAAISYLKSEYMPLWYEVNKSTDQDSVAHVSYKWHCDGGPEKHLKIIVYLNSMSEHNGATLLADIETTRNLKEAGYIFNDPGFRQADLTALTQEFNLPHNTEFFELNSGDAIIFNPYDLAHRGQAPNAGTPRYVLTLCLVQSPMCWKECIENIYYPVYHCDHWTNVSPL